ncbi:MAG: triose-phosphate isomerase [Marinifilaceae bacterium]|jgi:triosephosphate isomerase|nr:triose-phosphate isomerase [Marinifilaceae bacterium]
MTRKNIVAGNWKMNKNLQEGVELIQNLNDVLTEEAIADTQVIVSVPFIHLVKARELANSNIKVAAQNCSDKSSGAYTGEISAEMIKSTAATHVIIGHSERRSYYNETEQILAEKVKMAFENNLTPIFCVGEQLSERESGKHFDLVKSQLEKSLFDLSEDQISKLVIAYEPVWAIGTGVTASADQAQEMHAFIRKTLTEKYSKETADSISLLYGGSCNPKNAKELFSNADVDGGLIGGASLKANDFVEIVKAFN